MYFALRFPPSVRTFVGSFLALAAFSLTAHAQVAAPERVPGIPLTVGIGYSNYDLDWGQGRRMSGISANLDYRVWHGLSVDAETHIIDFGRPSGLPNQEQLTWGGGPLYRTRRQYFGLQPYAKLMFEEGTEHFQPIRTTGVSTDHDFVLAPGGGVEAPLTRHLAVRVDYEYQFWHKFLNSPHYLTPQGITVGAEWNLRGFGHHYWHRHDGYYAQPAPVVVLPAPPPPQQ